MSDAGLRRLLERATAEPPADLEGRVFRRARHPWRWTAAAAAIVLVAGAVGWSLAGEGTDPSRIASDPGGELGRFPIDEVHPSVVTWLPSGFEQTARDPGSTTWSGPNSVTITAGSGEPIAVPGSQSIPRPPPGGLHTVSTSEGITHVAGCSVSLCWVRVTGDVDQDRELRILARRVAAGVTARDRLSSAGTDLPSSLGVADPRPEAQQSKYVYRLAFDDTVPSSLDGKLVSQLPFAYPPPVAGSIVNLTLGALPEHAGFDPVLAAGRLVGWMEMDFRLVDGPKPVISFLQEERLQGYLIPGEGFVWLDELFGRRDATTTTIDRDVVPELGSIPSEVVVVNAGPGEDGQERRIDVFALDGAKVASLPGWRTHDQAGPGHEVLVAPDGRLYALTRSGLRPSSAPPPPSHDRCGPVGPAGQRVCGSEPGVHDVEPTITLERDGQAPRRITGSPIPMLEGRWRGYWSGGPELGPDGRTILATFLAECDSPSMYFVDLVTGRAYQPQTGGEVRESAGMGWSDAGEAIVNFTTGVCGSAADEPGVYRLRPDGTVAGVIIRFTSPDPVYPVLVRLD
jgi:hypothetical protein